MYAKTFIVLFLLCGSLFGVKFPKEVLRCKKGDEECMINSANAMVRNFVDGNKNLHLLPMDPLEVPRIYIKQGAESPVNVELIFTNNKVIGLKDCTFNKIKGFDDNVEGKYELGYKGKKIELAGPYSISGRILILPIQGEGLSNITIMEPEFTIRFKGKKVKKNGKEYLKPENTKLLFTTTRMYLQLDNLYNGDKLLGDSTNLFLNENWKDVFPEIRQSVFDAFAQIVENYLANIFAKVPYDELFAEDAQ